MYVHVEKEYGIVCTYMYVPTRTCFCYHFSTSFTEDEYEIVTNHIFTLCNLTNPGFCTVSYVTTTVLATIQLMQRHIDAHV